MSISSFVSSLTNSLVEKTILYLAIAVGIYKISQITLSFTSLIVDLFVLKGTNFEKYGANSGKWAVVTGASDGIGKEYSLQLAAQGFNIVLISRTQSKLDLIATEIESKYKVETETIAFDASTDDESNYTRISEIVEQLPVSVLVNNVGQSHSIPVPFLETNDKELRDIIVINNVATLKITQAVLPAIVSSVKKENKKIRGLILTMGSFGGLLPTPYLATYSGSKAFLQSWSSALAGELKPQGIDVELIISYLVTSAMSKIRRASLTIPNPRSFVKSVLQHTGRRNGAQDRFATSTPYWSHALMHFGIENTVGVYSKIANTLNSNMHKSIRARALKKAARLANEKKD